MVLELDNDHHMHPKALNSICGQAQDRESPSPDPLTTQERIENIAKQAKQNAEQLSKFEQEERVEVLQRYQVLGPDNELPGSRDITSLVSKLCKCPCSFISIVDTIDSIVHVKSAVGQMIEVGPYEFTEESICPHTIFSDDLYIVEDTLDHEIFKHASYVKEPPFLRFYAGAPLVTRDGCRLGSLCIVDKEPRQLSALEKETLRTLAKQVVSQLETRVHMRELLETQTALEMKNRDLERLSAEKSKMLGIMSHDVRQPLSNILVSAELLLTMERDSASSRQQTALNLDQKEDGTRTGTLSEEALQLVSNIHASASFAHVLVDELLVMAKSDFGIVPVEVQPEQTNMIRLLKSIVDQNRLFAAGKNIELQFLIRKSDDSDDCVSYEQWYLDQNTMEPFPIDTNEEITTNNQNSSIQQQSTVTNGSCFTSKKDIVMCQVDAHKIEQAMNNLVSNAVKFSFPNTRIRVVVCFTDNEMKISIEDQGQGIPRDELKYLFKPGKRCSVRPTSGETSTGLGLAIVKNIIKAHKGHIRVSSEVGSGTTFQITLPKTSDQSQSDRNGTERSSSTGSVSKNHHNTQTFSNTTSHLDGQGGNHRKLRVLCAEDNLVTQKLLGTIFRKRGHEVELASDGQETIDIIEMNKPNPFDILLVDGYMPKMSGLEVIRTIRKQEQTESDSRRLPIICVTGQVSSEFNDMITEAGGDGYVTKPFNVSQLVQLIEKVAANNIT